MAEADVPLYQDLNRPQDRFDLGFSDGDSEKLAGSQVFPFRVLPGDDASCLNLYRPEKPRILGVTPGFVQRGGFHFKQHLELPEGQTNPWSLLEQGEDLELGNLDVVDVIASLDRLRALGILSEEEFTQKKTELLGKL